MSKSVISSIDLCPINFQTFGEVNRITENMEATLLFSKIKFHQVNSVIESDGKTWIIRSRKQLAEWFQFTEKKIDALLSLLYEKGLVQKVVRLWHGKKALMLHASTEIMSIPIHHQKFSSLVEYIGNIHSTIIFSKIAFHFNNSQISHDHKKWCSIKKEVLASWAGISIRKLDRVIEELVKNGILLKKNFIWYGKRQLHFHIPDFAKKVLYEHMSETKGQNAIPVATSQLISSAVNIVNNIVDTNTIKEEGRGEVKNSLPYASICLSPSAKKGISIGIRLNTKKTNNNTANNLTNQRANDITSINFKLTYQQEKYLEAALRNTLTRSQIMVSNQPELLEELKFSVSNLEQHKGITSFPHAVSRCMKIISQNNWKTPIGFYKYSSVGQNLKNQQLSKEDQWKQQKNKEIKGAEKFQKEILRHKSYDAEATEQGIRLAKRISELSMAENDQFSKENIRLAEIMILQLQIHLSQGADHQLINNILKNRNVI